MKRFKVGDRVRTAVEISPFPEGVVGVITEVAESSLFFDYKIALETPEGVVWDEGYALYNDDEVEYADSEPVPVTLQELTEVYNEGYSKIGPFEQRDYALYWLLEKFNITKKEGN